jgi:feruloyl esterase
MNRLRPITPIAALALLALGGCIREEEAAPCQRLEQLALDHGRVVSAAAYRGGAEFSLFGALVGVPFFHVPASCRVELELRPSEDSRIRTAVWLPHEDWNGRMQGIGNGGFAGAIDKLSLLYALQQHTAAVATDTGHEAGDRDGRWALKHPEKKIDYGYRAIHESAVAAKQLIKAYYGRPAQHAYFGSCSNGGREGLMEAQRYPEDYDGVLAGAPALNPTTGLPAWAWIQQRLDQPGAYIPRAKLPAIAAATLAACDASDGVKDGVIDNPPACAFDPGVLQCRGAEDDRCLTAKQVQSLRDIYSGPDAAHHGFEPGGELGDKGGWRDWFTGDQPRDNIQYGYAQDFYRYLVYDDPDWSLEHFDLARDGAAMRQRLHEVLDAEDPDLGRFVARGGKLILFHGWNDPALAPLTTVDYYERVRASLGAERADQAVRLYMVPGLQHCIGGPGPNVFGGLPPGGDADPTQNISAALQAWVEQNRRPEAIIATRYDSDLKPLIAPDKARALRSRPLCPYPQLARWTGQGSTDEARNFRCVPP